MRPFLALCRKELASLFGAPTAYLALLVVALVTALIFFDHLRLYNQILFLYASSTIGGFDVDAIPDHVNLWNNVFAPVSENLGLTLMAAVPLVTMRAFAEERARGTDELLLATGLGPARIALAKFATTYAFVALMMAVSFVYPCTAVRQGGIGLEHLAAVFAGMLLHGIALASLGLVCSAWTGSQLVAAASGWAAAFLLWDWSWANAFVGERTAALLDRIALHPRYGGFAEGVFGLDDLAYFVGIPLVAYALVRLALDLRRIAP